jgi:hypothetical protein
MARIEIPFSQCADIIRAGFPDAASKRTVKVEVCERYQVSDYWSEGSRYFSAVVKLETLQGIAAARAITEEERASHPNNPLNLPMGQIEIAPGYCVVERCIFRGKDLGYRIYLRAENLTPALQAPAPTDLDARDKRILACYRSLKSGPYRKEALARLSYTDADRTRLAAGGYLKVASNGATAITIEGRTACAEERVW